LSFHEPYDLAEIFVKQGLAPSLKNYRLHLVKIGEKLSEVIDVHVAVLPVTAFLPYAHFASEKASRGEFDLPCKEGFLGS
jgi:hypothetical protein